MYEDLKTCLNPERSNEERMVYSNPEQNLENTKTITKLELKGNKKDKSDEEDLDKSDKRINMALKIIGTVCVIILLLGLGFIWVFSSKKTKSVYVPDELVGLTEKDACKKIKAVGLSCNVQYVFDEEVEEGLVVSSSPKSNTKLKEGNSVIIKVSSYEDTVLVENYEGKNLETIKAYLEEQNIRVVTTPKKVTKDDNIDENTIISQSVEEGARLQKNNDVIELVYAVLISVYPDFTDGTYTKDLVQQFCDDNKITCIFRSEEDNNFIEGTIILQSRAVGDEVREGTSITITVVTNSKQDIEEEENEDNE